MEEYRLIGYEKRDVADMDFRNEKVDGGEVGTGHSVTALYDIVLSKVNVSPLTVHVRYKIARRARPRCRARVYHPERGDRATRAIGDSREKSTARQGGGSAIEML